MKMSRMTGGNAITLGILALLGAVPLTAAAQVGQTQLVVSGTVMLKSTSSSAIRNASPQALQAASQNAWRVMKTRPEFGSKAQNLSAEQDAIMVANLQDPMRCQISDVDKVVDKDARKLTMRFRFDCDQNRIQGDISDLLRSSPPAAVAQAGAGAPKFVPLFFAESVIEATEHDAQVSRSQTEGVGVAASQRTSTTSKSDDRIKGKVVGSESENVKYGERGGSASEAVDRSASVQGRVVTSSSAESSATLDQNVAVTKSSQTGGQRVYRAGTYVRKVSRPSQIQATLQNVMTNANIRVISYDDVVEYCGGPKVETLENYYRTRADDSARELPPDLRKQVIQAAASEPCKARYLAYGTVDINAPTTDTTTGLPRVYVNVTANVWDIGVFPPELISTVTKTVDGSSDRESVAADNAITKAADIVGKEVLNMLSMRAAR